MATPYTTMDYRRELDRVRRSRRRNMALVVAIDVIIVLAVAILLLTRFVF